VYCLLRQKPAMLDLMTRSLSHFLSSLRMQLGLAAEVGWPDPRRDADEDWPEGMWEELRPPNGLRAMSVGPAYTGELVPTTTAFFVIRGVDKLRHEFKDED
jgi:hypothetical protein